MSENSTNKSLLNLLKALTPIVLPILVAGVLPFLGGGFSAGGFVLLSLVFLSASLSLTFVNWKVNLVVALVTVVIAYFAEVGLIGGVAVFGVLAGVFLVLPTFVLTWHKASKRESEEPEWEPSCEFDEEVVQLFQRENCTNVDEAVTAFCEEYGAERSDVNRYTAEVTLHYVWEQEYSS